MTLILSNALPIVATIFIFCVVSVLIAYALDFLLGLCEAE